MSSITATTEFPQEKRCLSLSNLLTRSSSALALKEKGSMESLHSLLVQTERVYGLVEREALPLYAVYRS